MVDEHFRTLQDLEYSAPSINQPELNPDRSEYKQSLC